MYRTWRPSATMLDVTLEAICHLAGIATERRNIPSIKKRNGKNGQGDLVLKRVNLGGYPDLILDTALVHPRVRNDMAGGRQPQWGALQRRSTRGAWRGLRADPWRVLAAALHPRPPPDCPLVRAVRG